MSASTEEYSLSITSPKPPNIDSSITIAAVGTATAMRLTMAMMFITEWDFGENI